VVRLISVADLQISTYTDRVSKTLYSVLSTKLWTEFRNSVILSVTYSSLYGILVCKPDKKRQLGRPMHGRILLEWIF